ncbi:unnamed protein product [Pedinophyceae sp. YPF-701]|nr:unnamed protein product [Pedinophyceae sp. YPF-701]
MGLVPDWMLERVGLKDKSASWAATVLIGGPLAAMGAYYGIMTMVEHYVPYEWQYRPGTISAYFARRLAKHAKRRRARRPIRVYMDGCFDMMHYGHANALRQAKACGDVLVVGLIPDSEIEAVKGPPVFNNEERRTMVEAIKWVDEVLTDVPYNLTEDFLAELFRRHKIDYVVHGDDPCLLPDGTDVYAVAKRLGRFRMIKRTEGVSSTDIVGRMLLCSREHLHKLKERARQTMLDSFAEGDLTDSDDDGLPGTYAPNNKVPSSRVSKFLPTSHRIVQFSDDRVAQAGARVVYIDGAWDMFHAGHVEVLKAAKAKGDFLLVGVHDDDEVRERHGGLPHLPIMNVHERTLSVLACKYVDEVIIGAPLVVTEDLIKTHNIGLVVEGTSGERHREDLRALQDQSILGGSQADPYRIPREMGIYEALQSPSTMTTTEIIQRIVQNRRAYEERNRKKVASEARYNENKAYVSEK